jgi:inositol-phosphate phosphatase/L-galactose 1-phosphate phosphatase/histidinol-phosphatase
MIDSTVVRDGLEIAEIAAETARGFFRNALNVDFKDDQSPVTVADQTVEKVVRKLISERYPNDGIFGEEHGFDGAGEDNIWVVDPIDGTRSFISGFPLFGFLLAHLHNGQSEIGIISMPILEEVFCGVTGQGATLNGKPINVSQTTKLDKAILYINEGDKIYADNPDVFGRLMKAGQTRRFSYDCYPHALLAAGHVDAVVDYDLKPYDFLALGPVIEGAGGILTDWQGQALQLEYEGPVVAAATPELHEQLLSVLNGVDA